MNVLIIENDETTLNAVANYFGKTNHPGLVLYCDDLISVDKFNLNDFRTAFISLNLYCDNLEKCVLNMVKSGIKVVLMSDNNKDYDRTMEWNVFDVLSKPLAEFELHQVVSKLLKSETDSVESADRDVFFKIKSSKLVKVNLRDIRYFEALANHVVVYYGTGERLVVHATMKGIENRLPNQNFIRIHNSYIIRLDKISGIDGNCVIIDKKTIPVSRSNWKNLMQKLDLF
jgi:DNA-binding LytR/AlgR family response regulator